MKHVWLILVLSFTGCAALTGTIQLDYVPQSNVKAVPGAENVSVAIRGIDGRGVDRKVGNKKNGYGWEMAPIYAENDVLGLVVSSLSTELKNRGFVFNTDATEITLKLTEFYNTFEIGFWSGQAVADVAVAVEVKSAIGAPLFTKNFRITHSEAISWFTDNNARISLDAALKSAITKIVTDPEFIAALVQGVHVSH